MNHTCRVVPQAPMPVTGPCNIYGPPEPRVRRHSSTGRSPNSLLKGLRDFVTRPRSGSVSTPSSSQVAQRRQSQQKTLMKVQVNGCKVENVFDLREEDQDGQDIYNDHWAFRRPRSNSTDILILRKTSRPLTVDVVGLVDVQSDPYTQYMKVIDLNELIPVNTRLITVDKNLGVDKAFQALCQNNVGAALVFDSDLHRIVSIVTLTDFLRALKSLQLEVEVTPEELERERLARKAQLAADAEYEEDIPSIECVEKKEVLSQDEATDTEEDTALVEKKLSKVEETEEEKNEEVGDSEKLPESAEAVEETEESKVEMKEADSQKTEEQLETPDVIEEKKEIVSEEEKTSESVEGTADEKEEVEYIPGTKTGDDPKVETDSQGPVQRKKTVVVMRMKPVISILSDEASLVQVYSNIKIYDACTTFNKHRVHRLAVMEPGTGDVVCMVTLKRIIQVVHKQNRSLHWAAWLHCPIKDCNVGTWGDNLVTTTVSDTVDTAITKLLDHRVSGLPLVNEIGKVVNVLVKADVAQAFNFVPLKEHDKLLASPIGDIVRGREPFELLRPTDTVTKVLDTLMGANHVRSVFIITDEGLPIGCISLSDVIRHLTDDQAPFQRTTPQNSNEDGPSPSSSSSSSSS